MKLSRKAGVTMIEMIAVVAIVGIIAAIAFPAVGAGLETIRLVSAADAVVAFFNAGLNRAERRQHGIEFTVSAPERTVTMQSTEPGFVRTLVMPEGVMIARVHPSLPDTLEESRRVFFVFPGGTVPRIGVELANRRGARRLVRVDPTTGVAQIEQLPPEESAR
jgi:prepilin-type N-terminal cleavage/methylation domain-containing protein